MREDFSNQQLKFSDLPQFEKVDFQKVSLKLRTKSILQWIILTVLFSAGIGAFFFVKEEFSAFTFIGIGVIALFLLIRLIDIILKQQFYGFAIREKDILFRSGYISSKITIIPFNRIQHSAINRSFLDKIFGISSLKIYTAGGTGSDMHIPGLFPDLAVQLNQTLSQKVSENA